MIALPTLPTGFSFFIFGVLFVLLAQKEILRAWGRTGPRRWRITSNVLIGTLLGVYAYLLLARLLSFL